MPKERQHKATIDKKAQDASPPLTTEAKLRKIFTESSVASKDEIAILEKQVGMAETKTTTTNNGTIRVGFSYTMPLGDSGGYAKLSAEMEAPLDGPDAQTTIEDRLYNIKGIVLREARVTMSELGTERAYRNFEKLWKIVGEDYKRQAKVMKIAQADDEEIPF